MKRATVAANATPEQLKISIHALMKRATCRLQKSARKHSHFNPRPHEEGDTENRVGRLISAISIHALMKRATYTILNISNDKTISIHALMKRATRFIVYIIPFSYISIHALMKRATGEHRNINCGGTISIHALMKRATMSALNG